jgi:LPS-assembly lipoprotein
VPRQQYAALRAERDAQDRAAREIAEQLRLAVAQDLSKPGRGR